MIEPCPWCNPSCEGMLDCWASEQCLVQLACNACVLAFGAGKAQLSKVAAQLLANMSANEGRALHAVWAGCFPGAFADLAALPSEAGTAHILGWMHGSSHIVYVYWVVALQQCAGARS